MDCHFNYSLNLCSESECLDSEVTLSDRPGLEAQPPHTPNHDMLKVHRILFGRDVASTERSAKDALKAAWSTISDLEAEKKLMPECICCQNVVSLPCWYCVDCTGEFLQGSLYTFPYSSEFCVQRSSSVPVASIRVAHSKTPTPRGTRL